MPYTTKQKVRDITNLTTKDLSDSEISSLINHAISHINGDINIRVVREFVTQIDTVRQNRRDGFNKDYYVRNWEYYIGDFNDDGEVDKNDIKVVRKRGSDETEVTVDSLDSANGRFTLQNAPQSGDELYITYEWCYLDPSTPDRLIELATTNLAAAMAWEKFNRGLAPEQSFGNIRLNRDMNAGNAYYKRYKELVGKINAEGHVNWTEGESI